MNPSAIIVTRGDVDLTPVLDSIPDEWEKIVWNNAEHEDAPGVFGRYVAIGLAHSPVIYIQDDDAIVDAERIASLYEPRRLVANMPRDRWADYPDSALVGWGAVFDRDLPTLAFGRFHRHHQNIHIGKTCDVVFSALTPRTIHDLGVTHLPYATAPNRMSIADPEHDASRSETLLLCRAIRGEDDDRR